MSLYTNLQKTAENLLTKFGKSVVFKKTTLGAYNPDTGTRTNTETQYTVKAAILPEGLLVKKDFQNEFSGTDSQIENVRVLLVSGKNLSAQITAGDKFNFDSHDWTVVGTTEVRPANTSIIYRVGVRR
jgi:hypothetical protein